MAYLQATRYLVSVPNRMTLLRRRAVMSPLSALVEGLLMKKRRVLFVDSSKSSCPAHQYVLNAANEHSRMAKAHCEKLWSDFWEYADEHFVDEFRVNFHQRWFEMYLTVSLVRAGLTVESNDSGPDVFVTLGERRVWIEAVCATEGDEGRPDSVPPLEPEKNWPGHINQCVLRILNSLGKKAKRFKNNLEEGVVGHGDILVIAISSGQIAMLCPDLSECMLRSLYGVGDIVLTLDGFPAKIVDSNRQHIENIRKTSGVKVKVRPFVDGSMDHVSAVLTSCVNAFSPSSTLGSDFVLYPNLSCRNQWVRNLLPVAEEWSFEEDEDGWSGEQTSGMLFN